MFVSVLNYIFKKKFADAFLELGLFLEPWETDITKCPPGIPRCLHLGMAFTPLLKAQNL